MIGKNPKFKGIRRYLRCMFSCLLGMFFSLLAFGFSGLYFGRLLDQMVVGLGLGVLFGLGFGFYVMYKQMEKLN